MSEHHWLWEAFRRGFNRGARRHKPPVPMLEVWADMNGDGHIWTDANGVTPPFTAAPDVRRVHVHTPVGSRIGYVFTARSAHE